MIRIASIRKMCLKKFWGMSYPKCTLKVNERRELHHEHFVVFLITQ